jgi:hypothetical protein
MVNMLDDHDLIDGFGSYPEELQRSAFFKQSASLLSIRVIFSERRHISQHWLSWLFLVFTLPTVHGR